MTAKLAARIAGMLVLMVAGWAAGRQLGGPQSERTAAIGAMIGLILGLVFTPYVVLVPAARVAGRIRSASPSQTLLAVCGVVLGLIGGALLTPPLTALPGWSGRVLPIVAAVLLAAAGAAVLVPHHRALDRLRLSASAPAPAEPTHTPRILVDTSAIIDGRIADMSQTGFLLGTLVVPRFVLSELQHIADLADPMRRARGRRGLDMLNRLQKESATPIEIMDVDVREAAGVDDKLVRLAQSLSAPIITNDFNLNRVAGLQGVTVLNINQLANALKPVVLPGEVLDVQVIQEGREYGQGVGYLEDGTMIVVENGRQYLNNTVGIVVTRVLQTVAGRMIFGQPRGQAESTD